MASDPKQRLTVQEYLAFERRAETRNEFLDGEAFAMTGASRAHNLIEGNLFGEIRNQLKKRPCEVYHESMRVRTPAGLFIYPDVIAVCGEPRFDDSAFDTLLNPTLIVEVLSPSTETYDRGMKAIEYRAILSLQEYVLVAQSRIHVEHWQRHGAEEWLLRDLRDREQILELPSISCRLRLGDVYERVFDQRVLE